MPVSEDYEPPFRRAPSREAKPEFAPCAVPARAPLVGRHARLEPLDPARHGAALYRAAHESEEARASWEFMFEGPWPNEAAFLRSMATMATRPDWVSFAIVVNGVEQGKVEGMASYLNIVPAHGVIEIGAIWFSLRLKRTRAATQALYLMMSHAFDLGYRRVEWKCDAANEPSRRAARRLGFRHEGIFYRHMVVKGRSRDTAWYSLLDEEWGEVREKIVAWLDDGNFDENGVAGSPLSAASPPAR